MLFNRARAINYMQEYGLDVLVATSPVNITYFTDYYCWIDPLFKEFMMVPGASANLAQAYAVFPLEGEPALVVNPLFAVNAEELWVKDLHIFGSAGLDDSLPAGRTAAVAAPLPGTAPCLAWQRHRNRRAAKYSEPTRADRRSHRPGNGRAAAGDE